MKWKKVPGFQAEVTKYGDVRDSVTKRILGQCTEKGYKRTNAYVESKIRNYKRSIRVHKLVALAWVGPRPSEKHEVNHKDLDKSNNYHKNLEWVTHKKNMIHAGKGGRLTHSGIKNPNSKLTNTKVKEIRRQHTNGRSLYELVSKFNVPYSTISDIVSYRTWGHI